MRGTDLLQVGGRSQLFGAIFRSAALCAQRWGQEAGVVEMGPACADIPTVHRDSLAHVFAAWGERMLRNDDSQSRPVSASFAVELEPHVQGVGAPQR